MREQLYMTKKRSENCGEAAATRAASYWTAAAFALMTSVSLPLGAAEAATYFVSVNGSDGNPGTQSRPFRTILKASQVVRPSDIVRVLPGTYQGGFVTRASGAANARIVYISNSKWKARIVPPANSSTYTAWENQGDNVDIAGFEVDGSNNNSGEAWILGIQDVGSNGRIIGNHVHHIKAPCSSFGGAGVESYQWKGNLNGAIVRNVVHDIGDTVNGCDWVHGIYHTHTGAIKNNLVYNVAGWGIHLWHKPHDVRIINNTVFNAKSGGIVLGAERSETSRPADNMVVSNNIIYDNRVGISENGLTGSNNRYIANLVFGNGTNWDLQNGISPTRSISADPRFVRYDRYGAGDYRLSSSSPAIDAGHSVSAPLVDIVGNTRPQGPAPDIGAYEFCCR
jgi:Protein of unknown function (DUF1565)